MFFLLYMFFLLPAPGLYFEIFGYAQIEIKKKTPKSFSDNQAVTEEAHSRYITAITEEAAASETNIVAIARGHTAA